MYEVLDTGSAIKGRHLDIYMPSCRAAKRFGRQRIRAEIVKRTAP
jgi:3D (Asp-Asp-Asp) domain-containing protein